MEAFSTVKKSNTNSGHLSQPRPVGRNGLLNISNNVCCLKSAAEKSLEELCTVDLSKSLLDFRHADSKAEFKLKHIAVSTENMRHARFQNAGTNMYASIVCETPRQPTKCTKL